MSAKINAIGKLKILGNVHHAAYRCRDADQTRWFYEDVLGLPLAAAMIFDEVSGSKQECEYMHLFFQLGDGNFIAFFDEPDRATADSFRRKDSFDVHIAFEAESYADMIAWQERINSKGKTCLGPVDHGFVKSVYMYDPNGIQVEITSKATDYEKILSHESENVDAVMSAWTKKTRAKKVELFGADAIDKRGN